ncbi:MAG: TetR/AcrR family transcriptional regulator [Bacillota bacterium]
MERAKKQSTRNAILHSGKRLYEENGLEEIKVSDIAKNAGVARATFFTHFRHLEDLYHAIGEEEVKHIFEYHEAKGGDTSKEKLVKFFETLCDEALYAKALFHKVIFQDYCDEAPLQKVRGKVSEYVDDLKGDILLGSFYSLLYIRCFTEKELIMKEMQEIIDTFDLEYKEI